MAGAGFPTVFCVLECVGSWGFGGARIPRGVLCSGMRGGLGFGGGPDSTRCFAFWNAWGVGVWRGAGFPAVFCVLECVEGWGLEGARIPHGAGGVRVCVGSLGVVGVRISHGDGVCCVPWLRAAACLGLRWGAVWALCVPALDSCGAGAWCVDLGRGGRPGFTRWWAVGSSARRRVSGWGSVGVVVRLILVEVSGVAGRMFGDGD